MAQGTMPTCYEPPGILTLVICSSYNLSPTNTEHSFGMQPEDSEMVEVIPHLVFQRKSGGNPLFFCTNDGQRTETDKS